MEGLRIDDAEALEIRETYLIQIQSSLSQTLSPREVFENVREMREHLDAMASAEMEVGLPPLEAMTNTVRRFGAPSTVADPIKNLARTPNLLVIDPPRLSKVLAFTVLSNWIGLFVLFSIGNAFNVFGNGSHAFLWRFYFEASMSSIPCAIVTGVGAHLFSKYPVRFAGVMALAYLTWSLLQNAATWLEVFPKSSLETEERILLTYLLQVASVFLIAVLAGAYAKRLNRRTKGRLA